MRIFFLYTLLILSVVGITPRRNFENEARLTHEWFLRDGLNARESEESVRSRAASQIEKMNTAYAAIRSEDASGELNAIRLEAIEVIQQGIEGRLAWITNARIWRSFRYYKRAAIPDREYLIDLRFQANQTTRRDNELVAAIDAQLASMKH